MADDSPLAAALAELQKNLPHIGKKADAQYGKYADLADITKKLMPQLAAVGLSFTARPTLHFGEPGDVKFVLAYELLHTSGESRQGFYPLGSGNSQQLGSAITYARRYCLCAITGVAPDEDDDDGQEASGREYVPETRADGSATEAEQMRMQRGPVPGTQRLKETPADDPYYLTDAALAQVNGDAPDREDLHGTSTPEQVRNVNIALSGHGFTRKAERLQKLTEIVGHELHSSADLSYTEALRVLQALPQKAKVNAP